MPPGALIDQPMAMLFTLADEVHERDRRNQWGQTDELLAEHLELLSVMRIDYLSAHGVRHSQLPQQMHVPRPGERVEPDAEVMAMSPREYTAMMMRAA